MRNERNILRHELIGLKVKVYSAKNKSLKKISGKVIFETKNMLIIETKEGKRKMVPKRGTTFIFWLDNGKKVKVLGDLLVARPEDRLKKRLPKWKLSEINLL